ncbi:hypothetical protein CK203_019132 [Vitis vinifera]|uniref:Reverse transcriptase zinc-binding domain-containing protein n=1 Tax=Vitis vinifera TaxID=29760 RepID=A0A438J800_VITVI|nr:hypothetical protein CK203_019132 [Vitis vinifera]
MVRDSYGVGVWKEIRKQWELFNSMISFVVGNGCRMKFWKDRWCSDEPLCETFLSLFALSDSKELQGHLVKREQEDRVMWKGYSKVVFSIKGLYSLLETDRTIPFPLKKVWNP